MNGFVNFLKEPSGIVLTITFCVLLVLLLIIILINSLGKNSKHLSLIFKKGKDRDDVKETKEEISKQLFSHRFFSIVKCEYVEKDYNFNFDLYDTLLEHGIKREDQTLVSFKKLIANKFLSDCLFKYLNDSTKKWIDDVIEEYSNNKTEIDSSYMPQSMCDIVENLVHFTKETTQMATMLKIQFMDKTINGIPVEFVDYFCKTVYANVDSIQRLFSAIIYSNNTWKEKVIEILDIYELALNFIKNSVDSTLVVMNGQLKKYVDDLFSI